MEYSIYKDSKVKSTCTKINNILKTLDIEIEEMVHSYPKKKKKPSSLTLMLYGVRQISNGKGTTLENARASAYSEFMERLQNNCLSFLKCDSDDFVFAPDEKKCIDIKNNIFSKIFENRYIEYVSKKMKDTNRLYTIPFYGIKSKKTEDIPIAILLLMQATNGMSSGNTPEEAIVQGLSEIYERYARKKIILENISMPDIPEEIWGKYERIKELKEYIEQYGYKVHIKDASLGKNLPVACTVFENTKENFWGINFGAQPSLPIAIERTFTEFMQGGIPSYNKNKIDIEQSGYIDRNYFHDFSSVFSCPLIKKEQDESLYKQYFEKTADYKFSKTAWIDEEKTYTNKELLKFLLTNVSLIKDKEIFVRDVSYLNFPSYQIYIPRVSELFKDDIERVTKQYHTEIWNYYQNDTRPEHTDINSLISALEFKISCADFITRDYYICNIPNEYLLALCHIVKNDTDNILKYCEIVLKSEKDRQYHKRAQFLYDYFKNKNKLTEIYKPDYIKNMESFINNLTFEQIKKRISVNNSKSINHSIKIHTPAQEKIYYPKKDYGNIQDRIKKIRQNLAQKYIENTPNQMELSKIFDFI